MSNEEMQKHSETESYKKFKEGWFAWGVTKMVSPFVSNGHAVAPEEIAVPPWADNLLRHQLREFIKPFCYFGGVYELLFDNKVQIFYDCVTWMDLDILAY